MSAWKQHPEHLATQARGRAEFFASYDITIADVTRRYGWPAEHDDHAVDALDTADGADTGTLPIA